VIAVATLMVLTVINCFGVRSGSNVQSALMVTKIAAILALVVLDGAPSRRTDRGGDQQRTRFHVWLYARHGTVLFAFGGGKRRALWRAK